MTVNPHPALPKSIGLGLNLGIAVISTTSHLAIQMLDARDKVIIIEWNGDLDDVREDDFQPERGDGRVTLVKPGDRLYQVPPSIDPDDAGHNMRTGVPLWLLNTTRRVPVVLGIGVFHPIYTGASMVYYDITTGRKSFSAYHSDPRINLHEPLPEGMLTPQEQQKRITESGGDIEPTPILRPSFNVAWH
jgi:hypothetical protein